MLQGRLRRGACQRGRKFVCEAQQRLHAAFAQLEEEPLYVIELLLRQIPPIVVLHQEAVALHDRHAVIRQVVQLVAPLRMAELHGIQTVPANQMRHACYLLVLVHGYLRPPVQLVLFAMA